MFCLGVFFFAFCSSILLRSRSIDRRLLPLGRLARAPDIIIGLDGDKLLALGDGSLRAVLAVVAAVLGALVRARLPGGQLVYLADAHHPRDEAPRGPPADEAVDAGAEADADSVGLDGAVDDIKNGGVEVAEGAALEAADAGAGDGRRRLGDKVASVDVPGAVGPDQRVLGVAGVGNQALGRRAGADGHEAGEVKGAELHVGHGDVERAQFGRQDLGEGRQGGADGGLGGVEGRVDGGDDGRGEDEDLGRDPFLADGVEPRREQREEGLDGEDGLQQVRVEEVGKG